MAYGQSSSSPSDTDVFTDVPPASTIDISQVPGPIPFPFAWSGKTMHIARIQKHIQVRVTNLGRPLTDDEMAATVLYAAQYSRTITFGESLGILTGMTRAFQTRREYRSPFLGPLKSENGWFNGERVRILGREILRGEAARITVTMFRTSAYYILGAMFGSALSVFYASPATTMREMQDPRLKEATKDLRAKYDEMLESRRELREQLQQKRSKPATGQVRATATESRNDHRGAVESDTMGIRDDGSSTGREGEMEYTGYDRMEKPRDSEHFTNEEPILLSTDSYQANPAPAPAPAPTRQSPYKFPTPNTPSPYSTRPTEPLSSTTDTESSTWTDSDPDPTVSAWERIRRDSGPVSNPPHRRRDPARQSGPSSTSSTSTPMEGRGESQDGEPRSDEMGFSGTDMDRNYAREEAQRDFDARVERERRGGDFGDGDRRW